MRRSNFFFSRLAILISFSFITSSVFANPNQDLNISPDTPSIAAPTPVLEPAHTPTPDPAPASLVPAPTSTPDPAPASLVPAPTPTLDPTPTSALLPSPTGPLKEWTMLVFLNGNNNLDSFGRMNINQMEKVGSTKDLNVVVQWGSLENNKTQRLFITQNNHPKKITSPVLEDLGQVDMGDWQTLVDFIRWGVSNFPAKHYFIDVWNHGSGWHAARNRRVLETLFHLNPNDISWDDNTGHSISTRQLGLAMAEAKKIIGHKVDLYASDACLMAMAEVANEVADSVEIYAGSEEVEPGAGWPYERILRQWTTHPEQTAKQLSSLLVEEYVNYYDNPPGRMSDITFSSFDLNQMNQLNDAISRLGVHLMSLSASARKSVVKVIENTQTFTLGDYADLTDFIHLLQTSQIDGIDLRILQNTKEAIQNFIVSHKSVSSFERAMGVSIWLPNQLERYDSFKSDYELLKFDQNTHWSEVLRVLLQP